MSVQQRRLWFETLLSVAEADWVHSSMQMDFDEEVCFQTIRKLRDHGRARVRRRHSGGEAADQPWMLLTSFTGASFLLFDGAKSP